MDLGAPFSTYEPYRDTRHTVGEMRRVFQTSFADPVTFGRVRGLVEHLCRGLDGKDYTSEYLACLRWVETYVRYFRDPEPVELVKSPGVILAEVERYGRAQEDCESIAALLGVLAAACGGRVRFVTISFVRDARPPGWQGELWPPHTHALCQALAGDRWLTLDPVAGPRAAWMLRSLSQARVYPVN